MSPNEQAALSERSVMLMLNALIEELIHPLLKSNGFKKKGLVWNRERMGFVDVVTVQRAKHSTPEAEVFTVNLGVVVPEFRRFIWPENRKAWFSEAEGAVRVRLGDLIQDKPYGDAVDEWWTFSGDDGDEGVRVVHALHEKGIPFLDSFDSFDAVAAHLRRVKGWQSKIPLMTIYRALAEWKAGETSAALELLESQQGNPWGVKAVAVADKIRSVVKVVPIVLLGWW